MGKRKSRKIVRKKATPRLATEFDCPFCNHPKCINVKIQEVHSHGRFCRDGKANSAHLWCRVCTVDYAINAIPKLSEAVDVYGDWLEECLAANTRPRQGEEEEDVEEEEDFGVGIEAEQTDLGLNEAGVYGEDEAGVYGEDEAGVYGEDEVDENDLFFEDDTDAGVEEPSLYNNEPSDPNEEESEEPVIDDDDEPGNRIRRRLKRPTDEEIVDDNDRPDDDEQQLHKRIKVDC